MNRELLPVESTQNSAEYFDMLRMKFEFYMIFEKIYHEVLYNKDFETFLNSVFQFIGNYQTENSFRIFIESWGEVKSGDRFSVQNENSENEHEKTVYEKNLDFLGIKLGKIEVFGKEFSIFEKKLFDYISSQITLFYVFEKNKDFFTLKSSQINELEKLNFINENIIKFLSVLNEKLMEDFECDNIYIFSKDSRGLNYIKNFREKKTNFNKRILPDIVDFLFEKSIYENYNFYTFKDDEKIEVSKILGMKTNNSLVISVRNIEELLGMTVLVNIKKPETGFEKILDIYSLYFEKVFTVLKNTTREKRNAELMGIYSLIAELVEKGEHEDFVKILEHFFKYFQNYFNLTDSGMFFFNTEKEYEKWYSSTEKLSSVVEKLSLENTSGTLDTGFENNYYYFVFGTKESGRCVLLFRYRSEDRIIIDSDKSIYYVGLLLFNILYNRKMAQKIKELDRYAIVGKMAQEMAHEIRNPLGGIKLYIDILKRRTERFDDEVFQGLDKGIDSINSVITEMLDFTRETQIEKKQNDIIKLFNNSVKMLPELNSIEIDIHNNSSNCQLEVDGQKFERVFVNILKNAYQAISENNEIKNGKIRFVFYKDEKNCVIEIWNNGGEIEELHKKQIFAPFYTTRKNGNGLGLVITRKIINAHNGSIELMCENGWTGFKIVLKNQTGNI
ncbi:MAG: ATP-binding protein [Candidatus Muiribacteriota bacterium]